MCWHWSSTVTSGACCLYYPSQIISFHQHLSTHSRLQPVTVCPENFCSLSVWKWSPWAPSNYYLLFIYQSRTVYQYAFIAQLVIGEYQCFSVNYYLINTSCFLLLLWQLWWWSIMYNTHFWGIFFRWMGELLEQELNIRYF